MPEDNLSYPVLIQVENSTGSGFYINKNDEKFYFVTALHVIFNNEGKVRGNTARLTSYDKDITIESPIEFIVQLDQINIIKNNNIDVVILEIGEFVLNSNNQKIIKFKTGVSPLTPSTSTIVTVRDSTLKKFDEVLVSNEVYILGFPNSLGHPKIPQIDPMRPLLRKGVIAGKNKKLGTIILDCPVYFGNSGGLAIEVEDMPNGFKKFQVIGVVSQYVPFIERLESKQLGYVNSSFENSGYSVVVPTDTIINLINDVSE